MNVLEIQSMTYCCADKSAITLIARIEGFTDFIAMTCSKFSLEQDKVTFYNEAIAGLHGAILPYQEQIIETEYDIKSREIRAQRNQLLKESDELVIRAIEQNKQPSPDVVNYRQALRDIPLQLSFPDEVVWPVLN